MPISITSLPAKPVIFTKEFVSADQTITSAGALTLAHGLGAAPKAFKIEMVCQTAEFNWIAGNVREEKAGIYQDALIISHGVEVWADATNIYVRYGSAVDVFRAGNAATGATVSLTNANWKVRFTAWA